MKKSFIVIILFLVIISCSRNRYEKDLIGQWNGFPIGVDAELNFYEDSVVVISPWEGFFWSGSWDANSSKINLHYPKEIQGTRKSLKSPLYYNLNNRKDIITIKTDNDSDGFILLKVENHWKHYLKRVRLDINLPEADFELTRDDSMIEENDIDLFIAYRNDSLIVNNYGGIQLNNLNDFKTFVIETKESIRDELIDKMNFNLIVDRKVSEKEVDSIKVLLKEFPKMKIFRVYKKNEANYGKYNFSPKGYGIWNWYGRFE